MQASEDIEPCPFCAAPDAHPLEVDSDGWAVVCGACGAIGPIGRSTTQAFALWNRRPAQEPIAGRRDDRN